ncbi:MAG: hypothetical protein V4772_04820 [Pseudomonadota bacterium]
MNDNKAIRVIFVEDDSDVRLGSTQALELAGLVVDSFATAEEARARIHVGVPAVVLCDVPDNSVAVGVPAIVKPRRIHHGGPDMTTSSRHEAT